MNDVDEEEEQEAEDREQRGERKKEETVISYTIRRVYAWDKHWIITTYT